MLLLAFIKISQKYGSSKLAVTYVNNHLNKKNICNSPGSGKEEKDVDRQEG